MVLVGNSFGGVVALAWAVQNPGRTRGLVLVDAHVSDDAFGTAMAGTLQLEGAARDAKIAEGFQSWIGRNSDKRRNRLAERASALVEKTSLVKDLASSPALDDHSLRALTAPVSLLYGERSDVLERGHWLRERLPNSSLTVLPGATHAILWEHTERVRSETLALLAQAV